MDSDSFFDMGDVGEGDAWPIDPGTGEPMTTDDVAMLLAVADRADLADLGRRLLAEVVQLREQLEAKPRHHQAMLDIRTYGLDGRTVAGRAIMLRDDGATQQVNCSGLVTTQDGKPAEIICTTLHVTLVR